MELSVENLYGLLLRSRLLSPEEAKGMIERWREQARDRAADAGEFSRWMVANQYVTEYQATLLARGHADGFFLDQYKILERIGRGRMAGVYKAVHRLGQIVAIKVLPPSKAREPVLLARFQREARLAMRLKHPNVVRAFHVGEASGLHYLVMECLEGETLAEVLQRRGRLPPAEAVHIVYQLLLGLQHIHELGLVHRDLKPSNLMLVPHGPSGGSDSTLRSMVKILDLSLARALADDAMSEEEAAQLTTQGTLLGTPDYMAPEQARDAHAADIRADIYSAGCVLYHLIAGQPPFPDSNVISQMIRHATETARPLREFNAAVPDGLQQIVNWMMAKDLSQRYPTPARAAQALEVFLAAGAEPVVRPEADPKMRSFLTWLERGDSPPAPAPEPGAAATLPPLAVPAQAASPVEAAEGLGDASPGRPPKARSAPVPTATAADPAGAGPPIIDPVFLPPAPRARASLGALVLTRRDLVMFGLGVASVLCAIFLGWLLALAVRGSS